MNEIGSVIRVNGYNLRVIWSLKKAQDWKPSWAWSHPSEEEIKRCPCGAIWDRENDCWVLPK